MTDVKKTKYNFIDLMKLVMAFFVVAIHTEPQNSFGNPLVITVWNSVMEIAVPFFFLASGFLIAQKLCTPLGAKENQVVLSKQLVRILKMYIIWTVIYAPLAVYDFLRAQYSLKSSIWSYFRGVFLVGENYNSWMLWYLLSTIYAILFVKLLMKMKFKLELIVLSGGVVFLFGIFVSELVSYYGELPSIVATLRDLLHNTIVNGRIFTGFLYIPLGIYLGKKRLSTPVAILMLLAGFAVNVLYNGIAGSLGLLVAAVGLFAIVSRINLPDSKIFSYMREISTTVYLIHMLVWTAYYMVVYGEKTFGIDCFVIVSALSALVGLLDVFVSNKLKQKNKSDKVLSADQNVNS